MAQLGENEHLAEVTITVSIEDAAALALGPLDYAIKVTSGEVPRGGSPMRVRVALAEAVRRAGVSL